METIDKNEIIRKLSKMDFNHAIDFFLDNLTYYALIKSSQNYHLSHMFLIYIKSHLEEFKKLLMTKEKIRYGFANLFQLNTYILDDNLISIIINTGEDDGLVDLLNETVGFEDFYLNDNVMSSMTPDNKKIFENLAGTKRKYIYSITNSITVSDEEQKEVYDKVLSEYPQKFIDDLFLYSNIIRDNTPNEIEKYIEINKAMFNFTESSIANPNNFYNYLYNVSKIFKSNINEKNYYNTFLLSIKYPEIHKTLFEIKINNEEMYEKLRILSTLPTLREINTIEDLEKKNISELYQSEIDRTYKTSSKPDSADARGDYEFKIFDYNREVIKISEDEIKSIQLVDDDTKVVGTEYSHIDGLRRLYPEYGDKEVPGEIIIPANAINHDIILITEGDSLNIWLPNTNNISSSQIDNLEKKLNEISDLESIVVTVATESDGDYLEIPFSTIEMLIDYLKNCKKVRK